MTPPPRRGNARRASCAYGRLAALANQGRASLPLDVLAALTLLSAAPFVLVLSTSFVRIVVVPSLVRSAMGSMLPPDAVLTGLALILTFVVMTPTFDAIGHNAARPYAAGQLSVTAGRPDRRWRLAQSV